MNNVDLYCFSGTGNTLHISKVIRDHFQSEGVTCNIISITSETSVEINLNNTIGISTAIASFSAYPVVWDFISRLPETHTHTKLFFFSTFAGNDGSVSGQMAPIFMKKGYDVIGYEGFAMPNNFMVKQTNEEENSRLIGVSEKRAEDFATKLLSGNYKPKIAKAFIGNMFKLIFKMSFSTGLIQKMFKIKVDVETCTGCGRCADICPVGNFEILDNKAVTHDKCQDCMRCFAFCPVNAISVHNAKPYKACTYNEFNKAFTKVE